MTLVVLVCSPFIVATAKGSGNPEGRTSARHVLSGAWDRGAHTKDIAFVETVGGDN